jgi:mannose-1-phosphate guanylyltransferase
MIYAVVMAGGIGERFWPLSTPHRPKQLIPLFEDKPLLIRAIERLDPLVPTERTFVITSKTLGKTVGNLIPELPRENLILEPVGKNTAPAAALATLKVLMKDPDGIIAMFPSDHVIEEKDDFQRQVTHASRLAEQDNIVTFGVPPDYPSTGYGYIQVGEPMEDIGGEKSYRIQRFVEKPDIESAKGYVRDGSYLWNSGIFVWGGKFFLDQVQEYSPGIYRSLMEIRQDLDLDNQETIDRFYGEVEKISVDYAIMERSNRMVVIPASFKWDDLGSWTALERICPTDAGGNVVIGEAILNDVKDSIVYSENGTVALLGVKDLVVVRLKGLTMVCHRSNVEEVRKLAEEWRSSSGGE